MELLDNVALGFSVALSLQHLLYCLIGVVVGTLIGVLPGIGPVATISMLLPITYHLDATESLIMLAGIYYGAQYGGSTTAILVNLPGEASSVVTCLDGYRMAQKGKGGTALAVAALGSLFAGTVGTAMIMLAGPSLAKVGLSFGPAEYTALMALGLIAAVVLASGSVIKAVAMVILGLLIGLVGIDVNDGTQRFTWGILELSDGIDFVPIAMGLFGIAEVIAQLERRARQSIGSLPVNSLVPSREDFRRMLAPMLRGTALGSVLGILPGGGPVLASFASYTVEKKISRTPEQFGTGMIEGVAAPESANNAAAQTSFIPMLTLGIPSNAVMALMIGAMIIAGIQPGPNVMTTKPDLFWGVVASMWIGNLFLVIINLPLIGIWVRLLTVPYRFLYPAILLFCCIGAYSIQNSSFHLVLLVGSGVLGYVFLKLGCEPAPFLLGMVLGPQMEEYFRRAMRVSGGDPSVFIERPVSAALLGIAVLLLAIVIVPAIGRARTTTFQE
ncbi:MAG: tripartite tricarboxylate transporter permease [Reyranellaceae bacterium]